MTDSFNCCYEKVKVGNDKEMARSERNSYSKNRYGEKFIIIRYLLRKHIVSRVSSFFPIGAHSVTQT